MERFKLTENFLFESLRHFMPSGHLNDSALSMRIFYTLESASQVVPNLNNVLSYVKGYRVPVIDIEEHREDKDYQELGNLFNAYGSDKDRNKYTSIYYEILNKRPVKNLLEIGLGTQNTSLISSMPGGSAGASLRAFRDYLPNSNIYGADVDKECLFSEHRIKTFYVDQRDQNSLDSLLPEIDGKIDVLIDDGLHSPNAQLSVLYFGMKNVVKGGYIVIEDIPPPHFELWQLVSFIISDYNHYFFKCPGGYVLVCENK